MVVEFYYHSQSPPCCLVWMTLKALKIDYKAIVVDMMKMEHTQEPFIKINPRMQLPALKDGDLVLTESRAIVMYLCSKYEKAEKKDKLYPRDSTDAPKVHELLFRDVDNYHQMGRYLNYEAIYAGRANDVEKALLPKCEAILKEYDSILAKQDYIFGKHLTVLDFACALTCSVIKMGGFKGFEKYSNLIKWWKTLSKLPYFEECLKNPSEENNRTFQQFLKEGPAMFAQKQK